MLAVEQWAEIRHLALVEKLSQCEIHRRTGASRDTIRKAVRSERPPSYGPRPKRPSKLDPHLPRIRELLDDDPGPSRVRIGAEIAADAYEGDESILDDLLAELRPRYRAIRSFQRTSCRPGELLQYDLTEPRREIPVGRGQLRKGYVVTAKLPYSRAFAGALVFSKSWPDLAWGMRHCLARLGALPEKLVWDREGAIHRGDGQPTDEFAAFCGQLGSAGSSSTPATARRRAR